MHHPCRKGNKHPSQGHLGVYKLSAMVPQGVLVYAVFPTAKAINFYIEKAGKEKTLVPKRLGQDGTSHDLGSRRFFPCAGRKAESSILTKPTLLRGRRKSNDIQTTTSTSTTSTTTLDGSTTAGAGTVRDWTAIHLGRRDSARLGGDRLFVWWEESSRWLGLWLLLALPDLTSSPGSVFSCPYQNICSEDSSIAQARLLPFHSGKKIPGLVGLSPVFL